MPVELRKRKAPAPPPAPPVKKAKAPATKKKTAAAAATAKPKASDKKKKEAVVAEADVEEPAAEEEVKGDETEEETKDEPKAESKKKEPKKQEAAKPAKVAVDSVIDLEGFGGEIQTNDGKTTTLKQLVSESKAGVVLFTYPKASTPGCTTQACLFRDSYEPLTAGGLAIYGLSTDSPKANTAFKDKQRLPYPLLCDPAATLIEAIGFKKQPRGIQRGVFAVDADGKVLLAEAGGPAATVESVKALVGGME